MSADIPHIDRPPGSGEMPSICSVSEAHNAAALYVLALMNEQGIDFGLLHVAEIIGPHSILYHGQQVDLNENDLAVVNKLLPSWSGHRLPFDDWRDVDIKLVEGFAAKCVGGRDYVDPPFVIDDEGLVFGDYFVVIDCREPLPPHLNKLTIAFLEARIAGCMQIMVDRTNRPLPFRDVLKELLDVVEQSQELSAEPPGTP